MRKVLLFATMSIMLFSCSNTEKQEKTITNDMEDAKTWGTASLVVKDVAHSGVYSCKLDSAHIYSAGVQSAFKKILNVLPKEVKVKVWVYSFQPDPDATIVLSVSNNGQTKYWKNSALLGVKNAKEWTEVNAFFELPANLDINDEVSVLVWNPNKQNLYIDDLDVSFE